jgi:hypothetical protein
METFGTFRRELNIRNRFETLSKRYWNVIETLLKHFWNIMETFETYETMKRGNIWTFETYETMSNAMETFGTFWQVPVCGWGRQQFVAVLQPRGDARER